MIKRPVTKIELKYDEDMGEYEEAKIEFNKQHTAFQPSQHTSNLEDSNEFPSNRTGFHGQLFTDSSSPFGTNPSTMGYLGGNRSPPLNLNNMMTTFTSSSNFQIGSSNLQTPLQQPHSQQHLQHAPQQHRVIQPSTGSSTGQSSASSNYFNSNINFNL